MATLMLVNPRRRKRRAKARRRHKVRARRRRSVAVRRRRHVVHANPRRRRRTTFRAVRRRRHSNPSLRGITGSIVPTLKAGAIGAAGALANDLAFGYGASYLPAAFQSGYGKHAVKALGAVLIGMAGNYVLKGKGRDLAVGAMTVVLHDFLKEQANAMFPTLPLGDYFSFAPTMGYDYQPALPLSTGIGEYMPSGIGEYVSDDASAGMAGY
jgi:hypothetical protein